MAAYAEGLNILHARERRQARRPVRATPRRRPLRDPQYYQYDIDVAEVAEVWRRGSVVASWLLDLTAAALARVARTSRSSRGRVSDSGEGRWTVHAAVDEGVPAHVLSTALYERFSRAGRPTSPTSSCRRCASEFGGHAEKPAVVDMTSVATGRRDRTAATDARRPRHRALRRHRRPRPAQAPAGALPPGRRPGLMPGRFPDRRSRRAPSSPTSEFRSVRAGGGRRVRRASRRRRGVGRSSRRALLRRHRRRTSSALGERREPRRSGDRRQPRGSCTTSPVPPTAFGRASSRARRQPGLDDGRACDHGEAVRHGPRLGPRAQRDGPRGLRRVPVFRIDHFLGKEAVQNILALRFANGLFEPVWNRDHIDHVQIDVPETLSDRHARRFYEGTGAFRDMVVTHLFQLLGFVAMEPPDVASSESRCGDEKTKVFESMRPLRPEDVVRGQYEGYRRRGRRRARLATRRPSSRCGHTRQLALGRGAVLPAHRKVHGREPPPRHARLPQAARGACSRSTAGSRRSRSGATTSSSSSATRAGSRRLPGEGARPDDAARRGGDDLQLRRRLRRRRARARGLRAPHPRRDARRPHALHHRRGIERLWEVSAPVLENPPPVQPYEPGPGAPTRSTS